MDMNLHSMEVVNRLTQVRPLQNTHMKLATDNDTEQQVAQKLTLNSLMHMYTKQT